MGPRQASSLLPYHSFAIKKNGKSFWEVCFFRLKQKIDRNNPALPYHSSCPAIAKNGDFIENA